MGKLDDHFEAHGTDAPADPTDPNDPAPETKDDVPQEKTPPDLTDPVVQDGILNPQGSVFHLQSGEEVRVFPLSMRAKRRTFGFVTRIAQDAAAMAVPAKADLQARLGSLTLRVVGLLNERQNDEDEMLYLLAIATDKPGKVDDVKAKKLASGFAERCEPGDLLQIYNMLGRLAGVVKEKN